MGSGVRVGVGIGVVSSATTVALTSAMSISRSCVGSGGLAQARVIKAIAMIVSAK